MTNKISEIVALLEGEKLAADLCSFSEGGKKSSKTVDLMNYAKKINNIFYSPITSNSGTQKFNEAYSIQDFTAAIKYVLRGKQIYLARFQKKENFNPNKLNSNKLYFAHELYGLTVAELNKKDGLAANQPIYETRERLINTQKVIFGFFNNERQKLQEELTEAGLGNAATMKQISSLNWLIANNEEVIRKLLQINKLEDFENIYKDLKDSQNDKEYLKEVLLKCLQFIGNNYGQRFSYYRQYIYTKETADMFFKKVTYEVKGANFQISQDRQNATNRYAYSKHRNSAKLYILNLMEGRVQNFFYQNFDMIKGLEEKEVRDLFNKQNPNLINDIKKFLNKNMYLSFIPKKYKEGLVNLAEEVLENEISYNIQQLSKVREEKEEKHREPKKIHIDTSENKESYILYTKEIYNRFILSGQPKRLFFSFLNEELGSKGPVENKHNKSVLESINNFKEGVVKDIIIVCQEQIERCHKEMEIIEDKSGKEASVEDEKNYQEANKTFFFFGALIINLTPSQGKEDLFKNPGELKRKLRQTINGQIPSNEIDEAFDSVYNFLFDRFKTEFDLNQKPEKLPDSFFEKPEKPRSILKKTKPSEPHVGKGQTPDHK